MGINRHKTIDLDTTALTGMTQWFSKIEPFK
jgi:hypothetical protein